MKIYVGNLPFSVDEAGLKAMFENYGPQEVTLISDKYSGRSKGFGFVTIENDEAAKKAISEMHEKEVEGRKLTVNEAKPKEDRPRDDRPRRSFGGGRDGGRDNRRRY